jgi:hypothetical protein
MTTKAAFPADEWAVVTSAPALTGMLVVAASRGGTLRESVALSRAYAEARAAGPSPLLADVVTSPPPAAKVNERPRSPEQLETHVLGQLRQAVAILTRFATVAEVAEYKRFVYGVAEAVANAHKEGGFLGVGGTRVSEAEQAVLDKVAALFDATEPEVEEEGEETIEGEPEVPAAPPESEPETEQAPVGRWAPPKPGG